MARTEEFVLWPEEASESKHEGYPRANYSEEWLSDGKIVKNVTVPTLTLFPSERISSAAPCLVICPGGGYNCEEMDREGYKVAQVLSCSGLYCAVLKYRHYGRDVARQDARRAVKVLKHMSADLGIDPARIGIGGFSAGGHLSVNAALGPSDEARPEDPIDAIDCRPAFLMLIYSSFRGLGTPDIHRSSPPAFIAVAADDRITPSADSERFFATMREAGLPSELHVFHAGEHGFDLGRLGTSAAAWPTLFVNWLRGIGMLP